MQSTLTLSNVPQLLLRLINAHSHVLLQPKWANHWWWTSIHPNISPLHVVPSLQKEVVYTITISLTGRWQGRKAAALWEPSDISAILSAGNAISIHLWAYISGKVFVHVCVTACAFHCQSVFCKGHLADCIHCVCSHSFCSDGLPGAKWALTGQHCLSPPGLLERGVRRFLRMRRWNDRHNLKLFQEHVSQQ